MRDIAIRGFINEKYGNALGKGLFKRAVYTGSVELRDPKEKYLIDLLHYDYWQHSAKSDAQIQALNEVETLGLGEQPGILLSWVTHYDPLTKSKSAAGGFCVYSPETQEIYLKIEDAQHAISEEWTLNVEQCKTPGLKRPVFLATTVDLSKW